MGFVKDEHFGWVPWSGGYGRRLIIWRSWVCIPAPYTRWTYFHSYLLQKLQYLFEKTKINKKRPRMGHLFKKDENFPFEWCSIIWVNYKYCQVEEREWELETFRKCLLDKNWHDLNGRRTFELNAKKMEIGENDWKLFSRFNFNSLRMQ